MRRRKRQRADRLYQDELSRLETRLRDTPDLPEPAAPFDPTIAAPGPRPAPLSNRAAGHRRYGDTRAYDD